MLCFLVSLAVQSCPVLPERFSVDRVPSGSGTYSHGFTVSDGYSVQCSYFDTRGQNMLEDCGSVTFSNFSGRRKTLSYDHRFSLACDISQIDYVVTQSDHPTLKVSPCFDGKEWTLTVKGVVWGTQTTTVSWEAKGYLRADFNKDGQVDAPDLGILLASWGSKECDLTGDGTVDGEDIGILLEQWT